MAGAAPHYLRQSGAQAVAHGPATRSHTAQSGAILYVILWWRVFCWHATKWRLCRRMCSSWQLAVAREGSRHGLCALARWPVRRAGRPGRARTTRH